MSKLEVYAVRDQAVGAFLPPIFVRSRGECMRIFSTTVNDAKHDFNRYASDYTLFFLGTYDDSAGVFETQPPVRVVSANEVIVDDPFTPESQQQDVMHGLTGSPNGTRR